MAREELDKSEGIEKTAAEDTEAPSRDVEGGLKTLVEMAKTHLQDLKDGVVRSFITDEFGKPLFFDSQSDHAQANPTEASDTGRGGGGRVTPISFENQDAQQQKISEVSTFRNDGSLISTEKSDAMGRKIVERYDRQGELSTTEVTDLQGNVRRFQNPPDDKGNLESAHIQGQTSDGTPIESWTGVMEGRVYSAECTQNHPAELTIKFDDGTTVKNIYGNNGLQESHISEPDGRRINRVWSAQGHETITLANTDHSVVTLRFSTASHSYEGERKDAAGNVVDTVTYDGDNIVYRSVAKPDEMRVERFELASDAAYTEAASLDANNGTIERQFPNGVKLLESVGFGRSEWVKADGAVSATTSRGDVSWQTPPTSEKGAEAGVVHIDGSGSRLYEDGRIEYWGQDGEMKDSHLTDEEQQFIEEHPECARDVIEVHRKLDASTPEGQETIEQLYAQLERINQVPEQNLTPDEKHDLQVNLLHHIACPEEIYQGASPTCHMAVIQRNLAMGEPADYVAFVADVMEDGQFKYKDKNGMEHTAPCDVDNLRMLDSTGRDLGSRIFQTASLNVFFQPAMQFRNTESGAGERVTAQGSRPFEGLYPYEIAEAQYKLTGDDHGTVAITDERELYQAWTNNGDGPMTVMVDASEKPFGRAEPGRGNGELHYITITHIATDEDGQPTSIQYQDQFGTAFDHSTPVTAVPAGEFIANMVRVPMPTGNKVGFAVTSDGQYENVSIPSENKSVDVRMNRNVYPSSK